MLICGVDFTSRPTRVKPIVTAMVSFRGNVLTLDDMQAFSQLHAFERLWNFPKPWVMGIDAPLSQPRKLIVDLGLPLAWEGYVQAFARLGKDGFVNTLNTYRDRQPSGHKEHLRQVDKEASSMSPMKLYGVPVGKMFFALAPRLLNTSLHLPVLRPTSDLRTVLEVYPALLARAFLGKQTYKTDSKSQQSGDQKVARQHLIASLETPGLKDIYGFSLRLYKWQKQLLLEDAKGDTLDALLAAIQTAWAFRQPRYGFPLEVDPLEGWISDPHLVRNAKH